MNKTKIDWCDSTQAENGLKRIETIWMNYRDNQMRIEDYLK